MKTYKLTDLFKTSWEELSLKQFIAMLELSEELARTPVSAKEYGFLIIKTLRTLRKNKWVVAKLSVEQAVDCFNSIKFFRRKQKGFEAPWYFFPIPDFKVSHVKFMRPSLVDGMPGYYLTFEQLVYADSIFSSFHQLSHLFAQNQSAELMKEMTKDMCALTAVLYCSGPFDPGLIERNAKLVSSKLSPEQCAVIMHTYANIRDFIVKRCPNLFSSNKPEPIEEDLPPAEPMAPEATGEMWQNLLYDLAETEAFKGFDKARNARIYEALDLIEKKMKEVNERKSKAEYEQA